MQLYAGIAPRDPPLTATWSVAATAHMTDGKLKTLMFEFDKLNVWSQWKWIKAGKASENLTPEDLK